MTVFCLKNTTFNVRTMLGFRIEIFTGILFVLVAGDNNLGKRAYKLPKRFIGLLSIPVKWVMQNCNA